MKSALVVGVLLTASCFAQDKCSVKAVCDPRGSMALDYMYKHFGEQDSSLDVWLKHDYGLEGKARLEKREHKFEELAKWAATLPDKQDRQAYLGAIDYYEDGAKEAYAEWHTHNKEREQAAYDAYLKACAEAARKSAQQKPLPVPPSNMK